MRAVSISPVVSPAELAEHRAANPAIRLLDVRTPAEFEGVRIHGSYNVPLDQLGEHGREIRASGDEPIVLICHSGQRARRAEAALRTADMPNLHVLDGGISSWIAEGQPVVRGAARVSLERQVRFAAGLLAAGGALFALLVNPLFATVPLLVGSGLVFAGITNTCGLAMLLTRLPYNRPATCDVGNMVSALRAGVDPAQAASSRMSGAHSCATQ